MKYRLLTAIVLGVACSFGGCKVMESMFSSAPPTPQQVEQLDRWKAIANALVGEAAVLEKEIIEATDPADRAKLQIRLTSTRDQLDIANAAIQNAETPGDVGWNMLEVGLTTATAFFPPAGIALIIARSLRRMSKKTIPAIFDSIKTGDGPKNPAAAKIALLKDPEARKAYEVWKDNGGGTPATDGA